MMKKLTFTISIEASREKVWDILWDDKTYRQWTSAFTEGSHAESDWKKGSKVLFLDGKGSGMVSRVAENIPNEYMSFEHLGEILNGEEDLESERVKAWAGSHENYTLKTVDGHTELTMDMDITEEFEDMFKNIWPKALANIKMIAENK
jgi:hypothetical protein